VRWQPRRDLRIERGGAEVGGDDRGELRVEPYRLRADQVGEIAGFGPRPPVGRSVTETTGAYHLDHSQTIATGLLTAMYFL
jgi:hypothetical protein